eukprot:2667596-Rhodomonas_salina.1
MAGGVEKVFTVWWPRGAFAALSDPDAKLLVFAGLLLVWFASLKADLLHGVPLGAENEKRKWIKMNLAVSADRKVKPAHFAGARTRKEAHHTRTHCIGVPCPHVCPVCISPIVPGMECIKIEFLMTHVVCVGIITHAHIAMAWHVLMCVLDASPPLFPRGSCQERECIKIVFDDACGVDGHTQVYGCVVQGDDIIKQTPFH